MTGPSIFTAAALLLGPFGVFAEPLMPADSFIPRSFEASLLTPAELREVANYRADQNYSSAEIFRENLKALGSNIVEVQVKGTLYSFRAWDRFSVAQDPKTDAWVRRSPDYVKAFANFWTGGASLTARGLPSATFTWTAPGYGGFSGEFLVDGVLHSIKNVGRFSVLLVHTQRFSAIPGTEPEYVCVDSTGTQRSDSKPVPRCDRTQRLQSQFIDPGPPIPPTISKAELRPFLRLHRKLKVSPLGCSPDEISYCGDLVRISCNADADWPVNYHDNKTGELLGTCSYWSRDPACMPKRWKACAVKAGVRHLAEEPDPAR